jgi:hypothetical protein
VAELDASCDRPRHDEYSAINNPPPPAYNSFEEAYTKWLAADQAKLEAAAIDEDPLFATAEAGAVSASLSYSQTLILPKAVTPLPMSAIT